MPARSNEVVIFRKTSLALIKVGQVAAPAKTPGAGARVLPARAAIPDVLAGFPLLPIPGQKDSFPALGAAAALPSWNVESETGAREPAASYPSHACPNVSMQALQAALFALRLFLV